MVKTTRVIMVQTTHKSDAVSFCLEVDQLMKLKGVRACKLQLGTARNKIASIFSGMVE